MQLFLHNSWSDLEEQDVSMLLQTTCACPQVGLQREVTPQPEPKPSQEADKEDGEEEQSGPSTNGAFERAQGIV